MARNTSELVYRSESFRSVATIETIGGTRVRNIGNVVSDRQTTAKMNATTLALLPDSAFDPDQFIPRSI